MIELLKINPETAEALGKLDQDLMSKLSEKTKKVPFGVRQVKKHYFGPEEERAVSDPKPGGVSGVARLPARMVLENDPSLTFRDLAGEGLNNKEVQEKADELIGEKAKEFVFRALITHGKLRTDAKTGEVELKDKTDLDGQVCLALLSEAGIDISKVNYIPQDDESKLPEAGFAFDVSKDQGWVLKNDGKLMVVSDKDRSSGEDSTAKFIYKGLVEFGLLKDSKILERIVEFATKEDNMNYKDKEVKDIFENYHQNLMGLRKYLNSDQILQIFKEQMLINSEFSPYEKMDPNYLKNLVYTDPKTGKPCKFKEAQKNLILERDRYSKGSIEKMKEEGFVLKTGDTLHGDVLVDLGRVDASGIHRGPRVKMGYIAARYFGFGGYVIYNSDESGGFCSIQTTKSMNFTLSEGFRVSDRYHLITKKKGEGPLKTTLEDVMRNLSGNTGYQMEDSFKEAMAKDRENQEKKRKNFAIGEYVKDKLLVLLQPGGREGDDLAERVIKIGGEMGLIIDNDVIKAVAEEIRSKKDSLISDALGMLTKSHLPILELERADYIIKNQADVDNIVEMIINIKIRKLLEITAPQAEEADAVEMSEAEKLRRQDEYIDALILFRDDKGKRIRDYLDEYQDAVNRMPEENYDGEEAIERLLKNYIGRVYEESLAQQEAFEGANRDEMIDRIYNKIYRNIKH
ncbi:MAG: hypothetical protein WC858_02920 [Parcubacteria group bacterium]|jgi:hypothetical protein